MRILHVLILSIVQGLAELLPVSSSAHVIVAAKLLHEDMSTAANAFLLVLLHTGTMFAVSGASSRRHGEGGTAVGDRPAPPVAMSTYRARGNARAASGGSQ